MAVTHFRIVEITKVGGVLERAGADPQKNIIIFLSLNWEPRYLSLKLTQCQKIVLCPMEKVLRRRGRRTDTAFYLYLSLVGSHPAPPGENDLVLVSRDDWAVKFGDNITYQCEPGMFFETQEVDPSLTEVTVPCVESIGE